MNIIQKGDKKAINKFVEEEKKNNSLNVSSKLQIIGNDRKLDSTREIVTFIPDRETVNRFSSFVDQSKEIKTDIPLVKFTKQKVIAVSNCMREMKRNKHDEINIYCMTTKELKARSVITITSSSTNNDLGTFGLFDKKLGCIEERKSCVTCHLPFGKCEGHEGHIPFPHAFINPLFYKDVIYALKSTCRFCGHTFANKNLIKSTYLSKKSGIDYKKHLADLSVSSLHGLHNHKVKDVRINITEYYDNNMKDHKIVYKLSNNKDAILYEKSVEDIKTIFKNYTKEDLEILGYHGLTTPLSYIMEGINTISPTLRGPVYVGDKPVNHYTTSRYIDLIKLSLKIKNNKECTADELSQIMAEMYSKIKELFTGPDNKGPNKRGNEQDGGFLSLLTRKEGLLRKNGMGKRVNFSCRTVASHSVDGNLGEIGVPRSACKNITIEEKVNKYNIKQIAKAIKRGIIKSVILIKDGRENKMEFKEKNMSTFVLQIGDKVLRPCQDGDIILFGRQPSLHAASLMGARIYLHDDEVFKAPIAIFAALNLDLDGDELTVHFPQTIEAQVEANTIVSSLQHVMNEQANRPMISPAFYSILGGYLATQTWNYITYDEIDEDVYVNITNELINLNNIDELKSSYKDIHNAQFVKFENLFHIKMSEFISEISTVNHDWFETNKDKKINQIREKIEKFKIEYKEYTNNQEAIFENINNSDNINEIKELIKTERNNNLSKMKSYYNDIKRNVMIPKERWIEAISLVNDSHRKRSLELRCKKHGIPYRSGRALMSLAFPVNLTFSDNKIKIIDGILIKGVFNKSNIGTGENSLVQVIYQLYSIKEADRFINEILILADWFLMWHSFSMGQQTFVTDRVTITKKFTSLVNQIQTKFYNLGKYPENSKDRIIWKKAAFGMMDKGMTDAKEIANNQFLKSNGLMVAGKSGSGVKGSEMNSAQITVFLGYQNIKGDIQVAELNNGTRRLVMFLPNDCSLESILFVMQSFFDGLNPAELYGHMSSTREGLVDTANNTADIGYTHRRLEKGLEDTIMDNRGMISSISGKIYVFTYSGIAISSQVFIEQNGQKKLSFCNMHDIKNLINRLYETIHTEKFGA